jgi:O-antigen/teichoic acid export membrane protein
VAQHLLTALIPALVFWFYIKWRPIWTFSWQSFRELFSFGIFMFLTNILNRSSQQLQGLLIGKFYDPVTMGYYSKALATEKIASHSISQVMSQVTYPLYSEAQDDKKQLANIIRRLTMTLSYLTFPLLFVLILCAKPIFILLYSDRWLQSVPYFQVLCIAGMAGCLQAVNNHAIAAIGESRAMFSWTIIKRTIGIVMMVGGLALFGMKGLLLGLAISSWFTYLVNISLVSKYIGYKTKKQILDMLPTMAVAAVSALAAYGSGLLFHLPLYADGVMKALICIFVYMAWSFLFKPESFEYTKSIIIPMVHKLKRKAKK